MKTARLKLIVPGVAALLVVTTIHAAATRKSLAPDVAKAQLGRLKQLAGTWKGTATHMDGKQSPCTVSYAVTAGGSAVVETHFVGTEHEMLTVFHLDGDDLVLTHYCMLGNQPRMKATSADRDGLQFTFAGGTNVRPGKDAHMHDAAYRFDGPDRLASTWTMHKDGKAADKAVLDLQRER